MSITVYTFENRQGHADGFETQDSVDAEIYAREHHLRLIDNTYEWDDSELVEDNTLCEACSAGHDEDEAHRCTDCDSPLTEDAEPAERWDGPEGGLMRCQACAGTVEETTHVPA